LGPAKTLEEESLIRVLLVDDEPQFLELTKYLLERQGGFETEGATSGAAALGMLKHGQFDAVVADYQMPEMDGLQLLKVLRNQKMDIPFVLFTGRGREDVAIEALNYGADFYLQKGGDPNAQFAELAHMIHTAVEAKQAELDLRESDRRFREMLANVHHVAMLLDNEGGITYCNGSFLRATGWRAEEIHGKDYFDLFVPGELRGEARRGFKRYLEGEPTDDHKPFHNEVLTKSGERIVIAWDNTVLKDRQGNPIGTASIGEDVTESLRARADLETQSNLVRLLAENARDLIYRMRLKPDIAFEYVSPASTALIGYTPEEHYANPQLGFLLVYPEDRHILEELSINPDAFENPPRIRWVHKNGDLIWTEQRLVSIRDDRGDVVAIEGIVRDVTKEVEAEQELMRSVQKYRDLVESIPCLICSLKRDGETVFVNEYVKELAEYAPSDLVGKNWWEVFLPDDLREHVDSLYSELLGGDVESYEMPIRTKSGALRTLLWNSFNVLGDDGKTLELINLAGLDITDWRRAETTLSDAESRYEAIFEAAGNAMAIVEEDLTISLVNLEFEKLSGYQKSSIEGSTVMKGFISGLDLEKLADLARERFRESTAGPRVLEVEGRDRFGNEHYLLASAAPIGSGERFVVSFVDQTEAKHQEMAMKQINEKISLLSRITRHDILNQLSGVYGYIQIARQAAQNPKAIAALSKAALASEAITRHLEFARDYQDMGTRRPMWLDAQAACMRAVADLRSKPFEVVVQLRDLEVFADPMLEKVFYNLLQNCLKHGKKVTQVRFKNHVSKDGMRIVCEDDGVGISNDLKERIFEKRQEMDGSRMGYGLYLAREILGITGIAITENGEPGKGARFELLVPRGKYRTKIETRRG